MIRLFALFVELRRKFGNFYVTTYSMYVSVSVCVWQTMLTSNWSHYSYSPRFYTSHSYFACCFCFCFCCCRCPPKVSMLPSKSALQIVILFRILFTSHPNTIYCPLLLLLLLLCCFGWQYCCQWLWGDLFVLL